MLKFFYNVKVFYFTVMVINENYDVTMDFPV